MFFKDFLSPTLLSSAKHMNGGKNDAGKAKKGESAIFFP